MARNYRLSDEQKLHYFHNTLSKDAFLFLTLVVASIVSTFQRAVNFISAEYNSPVRQARIKNYLASLRIADFVGKRKEVFEALTLNYRIILKFLIQFLPSHQGDAHRIEFLRSSVVSCYWAREPLSQAVPHQLLFQQLFGELESSLQLYKESKREQTKYRLITPGLHQKTDWLV